ncbi:uncharacterized protein VTP21DRAFT_7022 [Calcarisporiella thermophila]|uniref:uncharacterized protein n=1 Tax=Calcarisporiella thermophila TaxID=911321 RepID=UPI0037445219
MNEEERKFIQKYGTLPNKKDVLGHRFKGQRKYFDSGDYALSKVGTGTLVGSGHPSPETIPHSNPVHSGVTPAPVRRSSLVRETPFTEAGGIENGPVNMVVE